jgi:hypothetical protein
MAHSSRRFEAGLEITIRESPRERGKTLDDGIRVSGMTGTTPHPSTRGSDTMMAQ